MKWDKESYILRFHLTQYNFNLNHFRLELKFLNEDVLFL